MMQSLRSWKDHGRKESGEIWEGDTDISLLWISTAAGRVYKAQEKLLVPSFSFCWLLLSQGQSLCLFLWDFV